MEMGQNLNKSRFTNKYPDAFCKDHVKAIFKAVDSDSSGTISWPEFAELMKKLHITR